MVTDTSHEVIFESGPITDIDPAVIEAARQLNNVSRIRAKKRITNGHSEAEVLLVDIEPAHHINRDDLLSKPIKGPHYLKIHKPNSHEQANVHYQQVIPKQGSTKIMPRVVEKVVSRHDNRLVELYIPSHNTINPHHIGSLADLYRSDSPLAIENITALMKAMTQWNMGHKTHSFDPLELLLHTLGSKRTSGHKTVQKRVREFLGLGNSCTRLAFDLVENNRPNPIAFLDSPTLWRTPNAQNIIAPLGYVHGDLYSDNILCRQKRGQPILPEVIDYMPEPDDQNPDCKRLIFFDFAYLEFDLLALVYEVEEQGVSEELLDLINVLTQTVTLPDTAPGSSQKQAAFDVIRPIRKAAQSFIADRPDDYECAYWIAASAVGLNYARKRALKNRDMNRLGLFYAASAMQRVLQYQDIESYKMKTGRVDRVAFTISTNLPPNGATRDTNMRIIPTSPKQAEPPRPGEIQGVPVILLFNPEQTDTVQAIGKYPVTNKQYREFVRATGHAEPEGYTFEQEHTEVKWTPDSPLRQKIRFNHAMLPVVCVSMYDAQEYCRWLSQQSSLKVTLPAEGQWNWAAAGSLSTNKLDKDQFPYTPHHRAKAAIDIDLTGKRENKAGVSDMLGNIWEWCYSDGFIEDKTNKIMEMFVLKGGSFLEDLGAVKDLRMEPENLKLGQRSRRTNIGFRIWVEIPSAMLTNLLM